MINNIKTRSGVFYAIVITSALLLGASYSFFTLVTDSYSTSELLVSNLLYGISIYDIENEETIIDNSITIDKESEKEYLLTIYSLNKVESKYTLAYKADDDNEEISVLASNRSGWNTSGSISAYGEGSYKRTIKIKVKNDKETERVVSFKIFGGYIYNNIATIEVNQGYHIIKMFNEEVEDIDLLVDRIEYDTNCNEASCIYGSDVVNNYIKLNEEDETLYRVLGTYSFETVTTSEIEKEVASYTKDEAVAYTDQVEDTDYYIDWDKDFELTIKYNAVKEGLLIGNDNNLDIILGEKLLLKVGNEEFVSDEDLAYNEDDTLVLKWYNANSTLFVSVEGLTNDIHMTETIDMSGVSSTTLKVGSEELTVSEITIFDGRTEVTLEDYVRSFKVIKVASDEVVSTTLDNVVTDVKTFASNLDKSIYETKLFNCDQFGRCKESEIFINNAGILSLEEYKRFDVSYMKSQKDFLLLNEEYLISNLHEGKFEEKLDSKKETNIVPVFYLKGSTTITGTGTKEDPYIVD